MSWIISFLFHYFSIIILYKTLLSSGQSRPSVGDLTEVIVVARPEVAISIASSEQQSNETTVIESDLANISLSCDLVPGHQTRHQVIRHKTRHKHARYKQGEWYNTMAIVIEETFLMSFTSFPGIYIISYFLFPGRLWIPKVSFSVL